MRDTVRTAAPVRDLGLVYLVALVVLRRETWRTADRTVDVHHAAADPADQMVVIVAHTGFEAGGRTRGLNAPDEALRDEDTERVVDRLQRDRTDPRSHCLGNGIGGDVRLSRDHAQDRQSLGCDLDSFLPQALRGVGIHLTILDQILE